MTGTALPLGDRLMNNFFAKNVGLKGIVTLKAQLAALFEQQTVKFGQMWIMALVTFVFGDRCMGYLTVKKGWVVALKTGRGSE